MTHFIQSILNINLMNIKMLFFISKKHGTKMIRRRKEYTVFWDTGFIILKEDKILLHSVQVGGRMEIFELVNADNNSFTFTSTSILEDPKATQSQRIFKVEGDSFHYELNMATHAAGFQNHLKADLKRADF